MVGEVVQFDAPRSPGTHGLVEPTISRSGTRSEVDGHRRTVTNGFVRRWSLGLDDRLHPLNDEIEVRAVRTEKEALRRHLHRSYAEYLKKSQALRRELTVDAGTDLFLGLCSPMLFFEMTVRLGWPPRRWESSLYDLLQHALLRPDLVIAE